MKGDGATEVLLIRHAPSLAGGRMAGRRDVDADCRDTGALVALRDKVALAYWHPLLASPARRALQTCAALWPERLPDIEPDLWEQDFGDWEGAAHSALPDLGPLSCADLAAHRPPKGESFTDVFARVWPRITALPARHGPGRVVIVAHAGPIRAAVAGALAAGDAAGAHIGLGLAIAPLSATQISLFPQGGARVDYVNWGGA